MPLPSEDPRARAGAYLRANILEGGGRRVGRFVLLIDQESANPFLNYAVPDDDVEPGEFELAELVRAFTDAGRRPRLEYVPELASRLLPKLEAAGLRPERETMLLAPESGGSVAPSSDRLAIEEAQSAESLWRAARVLQEAFGAPAPIDADLERLLKIRDRGGAVALAISAERGEDVGAGVLTAPIGGAAEIAGVGVREAFRGRGVGASVTAFLARAASARGVHLPFLMAEPGNVAGVYRRAGFVPFGRILHISRDAAGSPA